MTDFEHAPITTTEEGDLVIVRIHAGKVNALDLEGLLALRGAIDAVGPSAIVLTGTERVFSAGVDLARLLQEDADYTRAYLRALEDLVQSLFDRSTPVVAALTGHAIAGGCLIASACDYRIMGQGRIGVTEALVGFPIPPGALEAFRYVAGPRTAAMVSSGRTVDPEQALALGLIDEVVAADDVLSRGRDVARLFGATPSETFESHKRMLRADASARIRDARIRFGAGIEAIWTSPGPRSAAARYLESLSRR